MKLLRLIADDLAGALDTSAQFAAVGRRIRVYLDGRIPGDLAGSVAIDAATRESAADAAAATAARLAPILAPAAESIAFKKVDSWLRGHPAAELAATLRTAPFGSCVIAPAFPVHGRITRGGRQYLLSEGATKPVGEDIVAVLRSLGIPVVMRRPGDRVPEGVSLWDAETDMELGLIARAGGELSGSLLWCGSGGLASAVAGQRQAQTFSMERPLLGIIGSDHPVTAAQLEASAGDVVRASGGATDITPIRAMLDAEGICIVRFDLPAGTSRPDAAIRIAGAIRGITPFVPRPGSLLVSGGETTRAVCLSVGADHLEVEGELSPGIPVSRIAGGRWDGVRVVSKSGAFGDEMMMLRLKALLS